MHTSVVDRYRRQWPRVAAVQAMALGGASVLFGDRRPATADEVIVRSGVKSRAGDRDRVSS